uniref:Uncharacterized protein n=1 Tax=Amphimedon queenslandica TaxID=400682 RepID=A0A1X7UC96_AMPQE
MKLLTLSVLLMLACAAFGKAVNEVPVQEEDQTAVEDFELTGEEQTEDDSNAVMESDAEVEGRRRKLVCWPYKCKNSVSKRVCKYIKNTYPKGHKLHGRNLLRCSIVYTRSCHQICYYIYYYG